MVLHHHLIFHYTAVLCRIFNQIGRIKKKFFIFCNYPFIIDKSAEKWYNIRVTQIAYVLLDDGKILLVKSVFSLSAFHHWVSVCVTTIGEMHFFGAFLYGTHFFICWQRYGYYILRTLNLLQNGRDWRTVVVNTAKPGRRNQVRFLPGRLWFFWQLRQGVLPKISIGASQRKPCLCHPISWDRRTYIKAIWWIRISTIRGQTQEIRYQLPQQMDGRKCRPGYRIHQP